MEQAMAETERRRVKQLAYNAEHGITPQSVKKNIADIMGSVYERDRVTVSTGDEDLVEAGGRDLPTLITELQDRMRDAAANLEFEEAGRLRDEIKRLEELDLKMGSAASQDEANPDPDKQSGKNRGKNTRRRAQEKKTKAEALGPLERTVGPIKRKRR